MRKSRTIVFTLFFALTAGLVFQACSDTRRRPRGNQVAGSGGTNPSGGGQTNTPPTNNNPNTMNLEFVGIGVTPRGFQLVQGTRQQLEIVAIFNGTSETEKVTADSIISSDPNVLQVIDNTGLIEALTTGTGKISLEIKVTKNGKTLTENITDIVEVVTASTGGGGGGGSNPIPTTDLLKSITLTAPAQIDVGTGADLGATLVHTDNASSVNKTLLFFEVVSGAAAVDADGKILPRLNNEPIKVRAFGVGAQTTLTKDFTNQDGSTSTVQQGWNEVIVSNELTLTSSPTLPSTGLVIQAPSFISTGERRPFQVWDLATMAEVTTQCTMSIDDPNKAAVVNDFNGSPILIQGLDVLGGNGTNSFFTITATFNGMTTTFKSRVLDGNPTVHVRLDGSGNITNRIWDTHMRFGLPYQTATAKWVLPTVSSIWRCSNTDNPAWFGPPDYGTGVIPTLTVQRDATNQILGIHPFPFDEGTTTLNVDPTNPVGRHTLPFVESELADDTKWSFMPDGRSSDLRDSHTFVNGSGATVRGEDFIFAIVRRESLTVPGTFDPSRTLVVARDK